MKKTIVTMLAALAATACLAGYMADGKEISDAQFEKMYQADKERLFVDSTQSVFLVKAENPHWQGVGSVYFVSGTFAKAMNPDGEIISYCEFYSEMPNEDYKKLTKLAGSPPRKKGHYTTIWVINPDFSVIQLGKNNRIPVLILRHEKQQIGMGSNLSAEQLRPITRDQYAKYLETRKPNDNVTNLRKKPQEKVEKAKKPPMCRTCFGRGQVLGKSRKYQPCEACGGTGKQEQ